jgi:peptidoglycan/LPS O-acetylase OafA/YrhL
MNKIVRLKGLDVIRAIAILLVLARHGNFKDNIFYHFGWLGVDLFFVLSGFLVSGLLFKEYIKTENVKIGRFLFRRGMKIYPPFYVFVIITLTYMWYNGTTYSYDKILAEIFYLQSYLPHIWTHTWTLALEEHFYLVIALVVFLAVRFKLLKYKVGVFLVLLGWLLLTFNMRLNVSNLHRYENWGFMQSHLRCDGIIVGLLLSYTYHFTNFINTFYKYWYIVLALGIGLILPAFYHKGGSYFMNTYGLSLVNLGFGCFVILSVKFDLKRMKLDILPFRWLVWLLSLIGIHSYSIYLWHLITKHILFSFNSIPGSFRLWLYFPVTIIVGIVMSYFIEKTFLKLRDKIIK